MCGRVRVVVFVPHTHLTYLKRSFGGLSLDFGDGNDANQAGPNVDG